MDYEFDLYMNDAVQKKLATITDDELLGSDAQVTVVVVDLFETKADEGNTCTARKRDWSVIPDTEGDGTDALIYKGSLKAAGEIIKELLQQRTAGRHVHLQQSKDRRVSR